MANNNSTTKRPFLPFEWSEITDEFRQKAEKELNETDERRKLCLKELKVLIADEKNLNANTSDEFLLRFLRARKFNTKAAFALLKNYYAHRIRYPSLYKDFTARACEKVIRANIHNFLPLRCPDGSAVLVTRMESWNTEECSFEECLKLCLLLLDTALQNPVTQICGVVSLFDFKGMSWSHLLHSNLSNVRCYVSGTQDTFPVRHKNVHIVNNSVLFSALFTLVKPLLSRKIRNRIHFHGDNMESLHQFLNPSMLPEEFGGTNGTFKNDHFYSALMMKNEKS